MKKITKEKKNKNRKIEWNFLKSAFLKCKKST